MIYRERLYDHILLCGHVVSIQMHTYITQSGPSFKHIYDRMEGFPALWIKQIIKINSK